MPGYHVTIFVIKMPMQRPGLSFGKPGYHLFVSTGQQTLCSMEVYEMLPPLFPASSYHFLGLAGDLYRHAWGPILRTTDLLPGAMWPGNIEDLAHMVLPHCLELHFYGNFSGLLDCYTRDSSMPGKVFRRYTARGPWEPCYWYLTTSLDFQEVVYMPSWDYRRSRF